MGSPFPAAEVNLHPGRIRARRPGGSVAARVHGGRFRGLACGFLAGCAYIAMVFLSGLPASGSKADAVQAARAADDFFASTNIVRVVVTIDGAGVRQLRDRGGDGDRPRALARVVSEGRTYTNVSVQLKGFSTFRSIDDRPSLTLKFDREAPGQTFHGLAKLSLNNSLQDPSRLHEILARELFAAAGVPVPRATQAILELNGRDLGLYVLTEGFDGRFVARHFPEKAGVLYEGGTLRDIDASPKIVTGTEPSGESPLSWLIAAARRPDPEERFEALSSLLDLDRFFSMAAVETILCHSDSYTMNRNNYRLYYSRATGRFTFIPHGMDRILGGHRSGLDLTIVPPQLGLVSRAILSTVPGRQRYLERLGELTTNLFQPDKLCAQVRARAARLLPETLATDPNEWFRRLLSGNGTGRDADDLCRRIVERAAELSRQLKGLSAYLDHPRVPHFDDQGQCLLEDWVQRPVPGPAGATVVRREKADDRMLLHVQNTDTNSTDGVAVVLICRLTLPAGRYQLAGGWRVVSPAGAEVYVAAFVQRGSPGRFQMRRDGIDWLAMEAGIRVADSYAPEEVELLLEVRSPVRELRLDPSALRLSIEPSGPSEPARLR